MTWFKEKKYLCHIFPKSFAKKRKLKAHLKDKHSLYLMDVKCPICSTETVADYIGEDEFCPKCNWR